MEVYNYRSRKVEEEVAIEEAASAGVKSMEHFLRLLTQQPQQQQQQQEFECREATEATVGKFKRLISVLNRTGHARFRRAPTLSLSSDSSNSSDSPPSSTFQFTKPSTPTPNLTPTPTPTPPPVCQLQQPEKPIPLRVIRHHPVTLDFSKPNPNPNPNPKQCGSVSKSASFSISSSANSSSFLSSITGEETVSNGKQFGSGARSMFVPPSSSGKPPLSTSSCSHHNKSCHHHRHQHNELYELCPWGHHPVETNQENVQERVGKLLDQYRKKSTLYRTNTLLIPLGDDFRYVSIDEAEAQFRNYQMLFDYINSNPSLNAEAKFGTLDDYFRTLREEAERVNYSLPGEIGSGEIEGFPSLSGDFFTYADRQEDYWSGYYVSRPFFKAVDRVLEHTLRASEMLMALLLGRCHRVQCEKLPASYAHKLTAARRNLALFQHHDGVTGTAKNHVVKDYGTRMHTSLQDLQIFMSKAIEVLLGIRFEKNEQNPSQFEPEQVRSKYDAQAIHKGIIVQEGAARSVVIFNPLEQTRNEVVMAIVDRPDVSVLDSNWTCILSQVSPEMQHDKGQIFTGRHRVHWKASIPALGLQMYYLVHGAGQCEKAKLADLKISSSDQLPCPAPYACSKIEGEVVVIQNRHRTLTFNANLGLLIKVANSDGSLNNVGEEISVYNSEGSGAYLFKPVGDAHPFIEAGGQLVVTTGPLMQEVYSYPKTQWDEAPISHSTRVYNGENTIQEFVIEKEYHVEFLGDQFNDKELIVRYKTDIENRKIFFSDLNGFQMSRRETYDKIPVQGNYYPMPSLAFMQGLDGRRFSVHSRQSLGVASLKNGWLEIMLDRRLLNDDGRGLGQGVTDNRPMTVVFHILPESNISSVLDPSSKALSLNPSLLSHCIGSHLNYPIHAFIAKKAQELAPQPPPPRFFSPLTSSLPCDLHIVDFKVPRPSKYSFLEHPVEDPRFVLLFQRRGWDSSYCRTARSQCTKLADEPVNLYSLFKDLDVMHVKAASLNLLHDDTEMLGYTELSGEVVQEGHVVIPPMEIQAYKLELRPHQ